MNRRLLLLAPSLLATSALAQRAAGPPGAALTDRDRADLARVEAYLNNLTTLRARFLQIAQNGASAEGTAWIWRPGRMRFEYDPPEPLLLVADSGQFLMYDRELRAPTTLLVSQTPLGILLRREVRLSGDVTVTRIERSGGFLRVSMYRTREPGEGLLTLVFNPEPMELRQWSIVDAQRRETRVTLSRIETGLRFQAGLFQFNDPRFFEPGGLGAPQGG
ncbi:outer membrane lipoprotein carrier protein LolA [Roseomonas terrae]|jgi:outer membrane lipoprotein-sorting protein|uniref:Outer membrane lipoprotein carrier protein LolA n=1 Tax=Neoroseomonas terrae TaxID=424799 RepID=A0ABS5ENP7_9PROT|nr:outer membrane lipoprotein carrier protein LolA [Neoroseomonas terrae]MBR0652643.1 outer membrane lipoprotein carrier protein LolA [Neoroseomonas terrae]